MKKFTSLLIGVSLALAGAAFAQQTEESPVAAGKKGKEKTTEHAETKTPKAQGATGEKQKAEAGPKAKNASPETGQTTGAATTETGAEKGKRKGSGKLESKAETGASPSAQTNQGAINEPASGIGKRGRAKTEKSPAAATSASAAASASVAPGGKKAKAGAGAGAKASAAPSMSPAAAASASSAPSMAPSASAAPSVAASASAGANVSTAGGTTAHVDKQKVEQVKQQTAQIKQQHATFKAQARPDKVPAVTFNQSYRIEGSDRWSGPQYEVFRSYHPERHDRAFYTSRFQRVELIGGGYYYFNNGYWYPAWGCDPGYEYYAYDAPIYVGHRAEPPDRVIAEVQAELQQMGYYQGEVDGLLGPLTRQALTAYQADQGLQVTAVIDEPTLDSLQLG